MVMPDKGRVKGVAKEEEGVTIAAKNLHSGLQQRERERESEKKLSLGAGRQPRALDLERI